MMLGLSSECKSGCVQVKLGAQAGFIKYIDSNVIVFCKS